MRDTLNTRPISRETFTPNTHFRASFFLKHFFAVFLPARLSACLPAKYANSRRLPYLWLYRLHFSSHALRTAPHRCCNHFIYKMCHHLFYNFLSPRTAYSNNLHTICVHFQLKAYESKWIGKIVFDFVRMHCTHFGC